MKVSPYTGKDGRIIGYSFHCPGCKHGHAFTTGIGQPLIWEFNNDVNNPTFSPSLLNWKDNEDKRCHLFVLNGKIQFLKDCFHELAGKTVVMEDE